MSGRSVKKDITFAIKIRESDTTGWSRAAEITLPIAPPPPSHPPVLVDANGDSRGLSGSEGQSKVEWSPVTNATSYEVRYCCTDDEDTDWSEPISTEGLSITISGLTTKVLYNVQVRAVNESGKSKWSTNIYTYPTRTAATEGDTISGIPINGYLSPPKYQYTICTNTLGATDGMTALSDAARTNWIDQVEGGIRAWATATGRMVRATYHSKRCTDQTSTVERVNAAEMQMRCRLRDAASPVGCAQNGPDTTGRIPYTAISLLDSLSDESNGSCTQLFQVAMHEAGHAYGLGHHDGREGGKSVMYSHKPYCAPTATDIVAIKAVYQSR